MLETAPGASGVGIDSDADAVTLTRGTLERRGLAGRSTVLQADVRQAAADSESPLAEPFDLALLANVVYYVPRAEPADLFRSIAGLLAPGGGSWWSPPRPLRSCSAATSTCCCAHSPVLDPPGKV